MDHGCGSCQRPRLERCVSEYIVLVPAVIDHQVDSHSYIAQRAQRPYEFPTGYNQWFGAERYMIGEAFFTHPTNQVGLYLCWAFILLPRHCSNQVQIHRRPFLI